MKQTEFEALAREYAESTALDVEEFLLTEHGAFHAFKWLSERYEIVSKDKIREEYDHAKRTRDLYMSATCINAMENRAIDYSIGRMKELTTLFPQTLKSEK